VNHEVRSGNREIGEKRLKGRKNTIGSYAENTSPSNMEETENTKHKT
jgi:hypothetical protein